MKKLALAALGIALAAALPLAAEKSNVHVLIGAEAALEGNFTQFGVGPWGDINRSFGKLDLEAYLGWMPYIQAPSYGYLFGEVDAYYHIRLSGKVSLSPALCVSDKMQIDPMANTVMVEPAVKLDIGSFFTKLCVPLQVYPEFLPTAYLEPGIHAGNLTLKLRGAVIVDPFEFDYVRWWADYAIGKKGDIYAYGVVKGFGETETIDYAQYIGFYIALKK